MAPLGPGSDAHTVRQAAYDLRTSRANCLVEKPGHSRRYHVPPDALRAITAVTIIRDRALALRMAKPANPGVSSAPRTGRSSSTTTKNHLQV